MIPFVRFAGLSLLMSAVASLGSGCAAEDDDYRRIVMTDRLDEKSLSKPAVTSDEETSKKTGRRDALISEANTPAKVETAEPTSVFAAEHNARLNRKLRGVSDDSERERIIRDNGGYENEGGVRVTIPIPNR